MKLKICGMKYRENIAEVANLNPDYMGFIFYPKSVRFVNRFEIKESILELHKDISKVGVFVNYPHSEVIDICQSLELNFAQLHGNETSEYTAKIKRSGTGVIKVFHIDNTFDWSQIKEFSSMVDFFLFDTSTIQFGGSGHKFEWKLLENYNDDTPFFLSGGIDLTDIPLIKKIKHSQLWGIDINSKMESSPALKNVNRIQTFINELKNEQ